MKFRIVKLSKLKRKNAGLSAESAIRPRRGRRRTWPPRIRFVCEEPDRAVESASAAARERSARYVDRLKSIFVEQRRQTVRSV